jgi:hypothetical protein
MTHFSVVIFDILLDVTNTLLILLCVRLLFFIFVVGALLLPHLTELTTMAKCYHYPHHHRSASKTMTSSNTLKEIVMLSLKMVENDLICNSDDVMLRV